jgi:hypothetical protein
MKKHNEPPLIFTFAELRNLIQLTIPEYQLGIRNGYYKYPVTMYEYFRFFDGKRSKKFTILVINLETGRPYKIFREPEYRFEWIFCERYVNLKIYPQTEAG